MYKLIHSYLGAGDIWHVDEDDGVYTLPNAIFYVKWLLERPAARILPGYTVTVVEVGV